MASGAGAILYLRDNAADLNPLVLIGEESVWEFGSGADTITLNGAVRTASELQRSGDADTPAQRVTARTTFSDRASRIEAVVGHRVQFSQPEFLHGTWRTRYRKVSTDPANPPKTGIPKGGRQAIDMPPPPPAPAVNNPALREAAAKRNNANREVAEETGTGLVLARLVEPAITFADYTFFPYRLIDEVEKGRTEAKIAQRMGERYSELFNMRFVRLDTILDAHEDGDLHLNRKTEIALRAFRARLRGHAYAMPPAGGRRSRRSSRRSKRSKRSKRSNRSKRARRI